MRERVNWITVLKYAGAFVAFMIGSGFATGQEVMQFFTAYGIWSIGGIFISMFLFAWSGSIIMKYGFENRFNDNFNSFHYFCGRILGTFFRIFYPCFLICSCCCNDFRFRCNHESIFRFTPIMLGQEL